MIMLCGRNSSSISNLVDLWRAPGLVLLDRKNLLSLRHNDPIASVDLDGKDSI